MLPHINFTPPPLTPKAGLCLCLPGCGAHGPAWRGTACFGYCSSLCTAALPRMAATPGSWRWWDPPWSGRFQRLLSVSCTLQLLLAPQVLLQLERSKKKSYWLNQQGLYSSLFHSTACPVLMGISYYPHHHLRNQEHCWPCVRWQGYRQTKIQIHVYGEKCGETVGNFSHVLRSY